MSHARLTQDNALHGSDKWLEFLATEQRAGRRDAVAVAASAAVSRSSSPSVRRLTGAQVAAAPMLRAARDNMGQRVAAQKVKAVYWANLVMVLLAWGLR